jgi:hypothetical protein
MVKIGQMGYGLVSWMVENGWLVDYMVEIGWLDGRLAGCLVR